MSEVDEPDGSGRVRKSGETRRREIMEATLEIITREGLAAWTTSRLADRVGISEATVFKHFESKDDILRDAVREQAAQLLGVIDGYRAGDGGWRDVRGLVLHVLDYMEGRDGRPLVLFAGLITQLPEGMRQTLEEKLAGTRGRLVERIGDFLAATETDLQAEPVANLVLAVGQSSVLRWLVEGRAGSPRDRAEPMLDLVGCAVEGRDPS